MSRLLDRLAAGALPAVEQVERDGWLLRAAPGSFKRSNSALALVADPGPVAVVERFYAERGLPARVQVMAPAVDAALAGWTRHDEVLVLTGPLPAGAPADVQVRAAPWQEWTDVWQAVDGRPGGRATALAQLALVRQETGCAAVPAAGRVAAVGRGAVAEGWLGVFGMAVLPGQRRAGLGRAVLAALGDWAATRGAERAYLQVLADNAGARALYAAAGFRPAYPYWYRTRPH